MKTTEYEFEERDEADIPNPRSTPQGYWVRVFSAMAQLPHGRTLFLKATTPISRDDLIAMRSRVASAVRHRGLDYTAITDFDRHGVWLKRKPASSSGRTADFGSADAGSIPAAGARRGRPPEPQVPVGSCKCVGRFFPLVTPRFDATVRNEAHSDDCPMYRAGAHYWPLPAASDGAGGYPSVCAWCDETRTDHPFNDEDDPGNLARTDRLLSPAASAASKARRIAATCPDCGAPWASIRHRQCKADKERALLA